MKVRVLKRIQMAKNAITRYINENTYVSLTNLGHQVMAYIESIPSPVLVTVARKKDSVVVAEGIDVQAADAMIETAKRGKKAALYIVEHA